MADMIEMKTLTIGGKTYEVVDAKAREDLLAKLTTADVRLEYDEGTDSIFIFSGITPLSFVKVSDFLPVLEDGKDGEDGVSPTVSVAEIEGGHRITVTDANGAKTVDVMDGAQGPQGIQGPAGPQGPKGADGAKGADGTSVTVESVSESTADGGSNVVTFSDGKTLTVKNGSKGSKGDKGDKGDTGATGAAGKDGSNGADGYTPQKNIDYFTEKDKAEIVKAVMDGIGCPIFGVVDENNNIIVSGDLADGTYTVKYEMEDGSTVYIGDLAIGEVERIIQCAYIENSDQNSYVDLGITNTETTGIQIKYEYTNVSKVELGSSGGFGVVGNGDITIGTTSTPDADLRAFWGGVKSYQLMGTVVEDTEYTVGVNYCNSGKSNIDGTDKAWNNGTKTFAKNNTITVCKQNGGKNFAKTSLIKIKEVYISEGSAVSKHYVPAYRSTDGAIGMLEVDSGEFIVANGNFTKGADV